MASSILTVTGLSLWAARKRVLTDACFSLAPVGMTALMGPVGTGKSTLLKWLCRRADPAIYDAKIAMALYLSAPIGRRNHPALYAQRQGQSLDQMMASLSVILSPNPALICVDEATADLSADDSRLVMERLKILAQSRAIMLVTHNQQEALDYADNIMLLAGDRLVEVTPAKTFFKRPQTDEGRQFIGSGWITTISHDTPNHHLSHALRPMPFEVAVSQVDAGGRLRAIVEGQIYLLDAKDVSAEDEAALIEHGITRIVIPRQSRPVQSAPVQSAPAQPAPAWPGIDVIALDNPDDDLARCHKISAQIDAGQPVAFCRNERGPDVPRAIAMQLIFRGIPADQAAAVAAQLRGMDALEALDEQELWDFEHACDLEADGVDPSAGRVDQPVLTWTTPAAPAANEGKHA